MKDSTNDTQLNEGDIYASRYNVSLARSQKVLQSWLPPKPAETSNTVDDDDESDFQAMSESAGLGFTTTNKDSDIPDVLRRNRACQDKLLEQLLGKKAAQAKKKSQEAASKHTPSKAMVPSKPVKAAPTESDEDEEEGRSAAFSSRRKTRDTKTPAYTAAGGKADDILDQNAEPPDPRQDLPTVVEMVSEQTREEEEDSRPKKRKAGSYLDELLAQKAKKMSKKKKNKEKKDAAE